MVAVAVVLSYRPRWRLQDAQLQQGAVLVALKRQQMVAAAVVLLPQHRQRPLGE